jgi:Nucleotidyl transferase AbiEii toxin, Type IV TA system
MDAEALARCGFLFGGGTRIVLDLGEYRESEDVDFLCSSSSGYAEMRIAVKSRSYAALFTPEGISTFSFPREPRIDQYGIRFPAMLGDETLKVELVREARIDLDPGIRPSWSPVDCLAFVDCYAEKLLANSDRWADRQFLSRDLLDLAALRALRGPIPPEAWSKVEQAYKSAPREDLAKALAMLNRDAEYRRRCLDGLAAHAESDVRRGLLLLSKNLG